MRRYANIPKRSERSERSEGVVQLTATIQGHGWTSLQHFTALPTVDCPCPWCEQGNLPTRNGTGRRSLRTLHDYESWSQTLLQYHRSVGICLPYAYAY